MDVHEPDALDAAEDEPVEHGAGRLQHAHDLVRALAVLLAAFGDAVAADELAADGEPGGARRFRAEHGFHRLAPQPAGRRLAAVVRDIVVRRAHDPEAAEAVAERERDRLLDRPVLRELLRGRERDIAGGRIEVEHRRQDELHRAPLRAGHEVDAARIAPHPLLDLVCGEQHERDRPDAEREQHQVERGVQRLRAEVRQAETREVHSSTRFENRARTRWS